MKDNIDYFEQYEILEKEYPAIYNIVMEQDELESYEDTERLLYKLNSMGWTFNYGLDNSPFNLRPFTEEERIVFLDSLNEAFSPFGYRDDIYAKGGSVKTSNYDNFFENNPEKVLGNYVDVKTKFGKKANVLKGKKDILDKIETPNYRVDIAKNFAVSESEEEVNENTITFEERVVNKETLKEDKQDLIAVNIAEEQGTLDTDLYSFDEVDKTYNVGITDIQKCAFVFYLEKKSGQSIKGGFTKYRGIYSEGQLMTKGELFYDYDQKEYQPRFLFESGNVALKRTAFYSNEKRYIEDFGERKFEIAKESIEKAYSIVRAKKLSLANPIEKLRLRILLGSNFAKETFIDGYIHPRTKKTKEGFRVYTQYDQFGDMKGFKLTEDPTSRNSSIQPKLNIAQAFFIWLRDAGDPNLAKSNGIIFKNGMGATSIHSIYYKNRNRPKETKKADWLRFQGYAKENGDRLFSQFLATGLKEADRIKIEKEWNDKYNSTIEYDTNEVPIGFQFAKFLGEGIVNDIRPEKRNAIAYYMMRGSCLFAYGVGIGKTWCSIFTIAQAMELGFTKRPLIVVPKQVYTQFSKEIITILGNQYKVNTLYNLSQNIDKKLKQTYLDKAETIKDNTISICTYDGIENMSFSEGFNEEFLNRITSILDEQNDKVSKRQKEAKELKMMEFLGKAKKGGSVDIDNENTNFDFICVDEAHNFKKLFTSVKGEAKSQDESSTSDRISREKHPYKISGGVQSDRAIKLFFITQYIQSKSKIGNCLLLTATPFTNSPLEIYSMLAYINYNYLQKIGFNTLKGFFDTFANMQSQLTINTNLQPVRKQVFVGWNNVVALQNLIFNMIDKKSREDEDKLVERPNKIVLPFRNIMKNGINYGVAEANRISTTLSMNDKQVELAELLKSYAKGMDAMGSGVSFEELCLGDSLNVSKFGKINKQAEALAKKQKADESDETMTTKELEEGEKGKTDSAGVRALQCLTYFRQLALNPYLYSCSGYTENPTANQFVEASPKMLYAFECINSVLDYEKENNLITSGQVVYMDFGTDAFYLLVDYAVKELGYKENEVGYITGSDYRIGKKKQKDKSDVQDAFLGRKYNEDLQEYVEIDDKDRVKLLFGSSSIREGMNLQFYASVLYNLYIDFNPTDNTQLEGRIWRQGNRFDNVRIVVPLMENSMDIFMFQKLEEKTERINQIWNKDGQTNELNTEDFNPSELKYELITDPMTLAQLQVEDDIVKFDEKIDDINLEYSTLNNFKAEYIKVEDLEVDQVYGRGIWNKPVGRMYEYVNAFRPDLVPLSLIKNDEKLSEMNRAFKNDRNSTYAIQGYVDEKDLNYTPQDMIDKVVQFHREQKFSFPSDYKPKIEFKIGDEVFYETKRGKKKGKIESVNNQPFNSFDLEIGKDDFIENIPINKLSLVKADKYKNEPFNPFIKDKTKTEEFYNNYGAGDLKNPSQFIQFDYIKDMTKWVDFMDALKNKNTYRNNYYDDNLWWSTDFPLAFKRLKKAEDDFLRPKGISNKSELEDRLKELTADIDDLIVQKKALTEQENLQESANLISAQRQEELALGIRKPSTYKERAKEFMSSNADYKGNDYLLVLSEKFLSKNIESVELLRKTAKYKELSKSEQKKLEKKVVSRLKLDKTKKKTTATSNNETFIDKRIKALKLLLKVNPKNEFAKKNIKTLELAKKFKK